MAAVDSAYASWLKNAALFRGWSNSVLPGPLAPMAVDSEVMSPFAVSTSVDTELARQGILFDGPLALDQATIIGRRVDLVGKCINLTCDLLDYGAGVVPIEHVVNGDMAAGTANWTAQGGATLSIVSGQLKVLATTTVGTAAIQTIADLVQGRKYQLTVGAMTDPTSNFATVSIVHPVGPTYSYRFDEAAYGAAGFTATFVAPNPSVTLALEVTNLAAWGPVNEFALFDDISIKEFAPMVLVIGASEQDDGTTLLTVLRAL